MTETFAKTKHILFELHSQFEEAMKIWKKEFTLLVDRINEQERVLPYTFVYKLLVFSKFRDFINVYASSIVDGAFTEALEMVKEDYLDVNIA